MLVNLCTQIQTVAIGWQIYALTGSTFDLDLPGLGNWALGADY